MVVAGIFMLIEIGGGLLARSLALMSDALHLFADVGALGLGWVTAHLLQRPFTRKFSYGYQRAEALGALISVILLWALSLFLIYKALLRFFYPEIVQGGIVFVVAILGLIANIAMIKILHPTHRENLNIRAAYLHVLGDLLGSIGVLFSGLLIMLTGWNPIDPIITLLVSFSILWSSIKISRHAISVLMESTPSDIDAGQVYAALRDLPGVEEVHDLHIWSLSSNHPALSVHLVAKEGPTILSAAHKAIEKKFGIRHMTIQIENHDHFEPKYCYDCQKNL
jgi:cobalt-zinc-cadmium efflux system protein